MELLIGMIISSILIAFCYSAYSIINKQYLNYKAIRQEIVKSMEFNAVMNNDFANAEIVTFENNTLKMKRRNSLDLEYCFNDKYVVRKETEVKDTFKLFAMNIVANCLAQAGQSLLIVDDFSFNTKISSTTEIFHFTKKYSAETLVNRSIQIHSE